MAPAAVWEETLDTATSIKNASRLPACNGYTTSGPESFVLKDTDIEDLHDLICVGFGPASLAIAIAIHDKLKSEDLQPYGNKVPKVKFLEKQHSFGWHAGMLLPGTKMQISFIKDLATLRDPRSKFTFLNYLKCHNRLVQFSNLDTFLPLRIEFEDYLKWCAEHFENTVEYSNEVLHVRPWKTNKATKFDALEITTQNSVTGEILVRRSRNVVIAVGGRPSIPSIFQGYTNHVIHSSQYKHKISQLLPSQDMPYKIAVVGGGQSAAEVFSDLQSRYPNASTRLIIRDTALRPSDDSPFVNEVFNPEAVDTFYTGCLETRANQLRTNRATNYSVVRLELLERIYEALYHQRIQEPDPSKWRHQILTTRNVVKVSSSAKSQGLCLTLNDLSSTRDENHDVLDVDAVILATGYIRDAHTDILKDCQIINVSSEERWVAQRDYQVKLNRDLVEDNVGIYLQGCNEDTHGLSDTLLSILATRSGELVDSIFGNA